MGDGEKSHRIQGKVRGEARTTRELRRNHAKRTRGHEQNACIASEGRVKYAKSTRRKTREREAIARITRKGREKDARAACMGAYQPRGGAALHLVVHLLAVVGGGPSVSGVLRRGGAVGYRVVPERCAVPGVMDLSIRHGERPCIPGPPSRRRRVKPHRPGSGSAPDTVHGASAGSRCGRLCPTVSSIKVGVEDVAPADDQVHFRSLLVAVPNATPFNQPLPQVGVSCSQTGTAGGDPVHPFLAWSDASPRRGTKQMSVDLLTGARTSAAPWVRSTSVGRGL